MSLAFSITDDQESNKKAKLLEPEDVCDEYQAIRLVDFEAFVACGRIPRYPDHADLTVDYDSMPERDQNNCVVVFVSHNWMRVSPSCAGWEGSPHPDTINNDKHELIVHGVRFILGDTVGLKCFLWIDYSCIDQDGDPGAAIRRLDKVMHICDVVFTPIYDPERFLIKKGLYRVDYFVDLEAPNWNGKENPKAYLTRAWCRLEMFYACNIPLRAYAPDVLAGFGKVIAYALTKGYRPHFIYTTGYSKLVPRYVPFMLPPLQNSYFEDYNPAEGMLTFADDKAYIRRLITALEPYMVYIPFGYNGELNEAGERHGTGILRFKNGDVYRGEFVNGKMQGKGVITYANGDTFTGEFANGMKNGYGENRKGVAPDKSFLLGEFKDDIVCEEAKYSIQKGPGNFEVFEGKWEQSDETGKPVFVLKNGQIHRFLQP